MCRLSWNLEISTSSNRLCLYRPVQLCLYLCLVLYMQYLQDFCESKFVQRVTSSLTQIIPLWPFSHVANSTVWSLFICVLDFALCVSCVFFVSINRVTICVVYGELHLFLYWVFCWEFKFQFEVGSYRLVVWLLRTAAEDWQLFSSRTVFRLFCQNFKPVINVITVFKMAVANSFNPIHILLATSLY